jgi:drug/metabolite transporter (DMT)-like permease
VGVPQESRAKTASERPLTPARKRARIALALLTLYVIWGSTYFVMRVALDFLPPFLMCGTRFTLAGALLYSLLRLRGVAPPSAKGWASALLIGGLLLVCGNGLVAIAEHSVDTGVAATVVATVPLWAAAIGAFWGERPARLELVGLLLGFAGVAVLNHGGNLAAHGGDALAVVLAPIAWALGSAWSRRLPVPAGLMGTAAQMLAAGLVLLTLAVLTGEGPLHAVSWSGAAALAYLIVFGSMIAFSAYGFLLRNTRSTLATSYAYVNPMVALALGSLLGGESFTREKLLACLLTGSGVALVTVARGASKFRSV